MNGTEILHKLLTTFIEGGPPAVFLLRECLMDLPENVKYIDALASAIAVISINEDMSMSPDDIILSYYLLIRDLKANRISLSEEKKIIKTFFKEDVGGPAGAGAPAAGTAANNTAKVSVDQPVIDPTKKKRKKPPVVNRDAQPDIIKDGARPEIMLDPEPNQYS